MMKLFGGFGARFWQAYESNAPYRRPFKMPYPSTSSTTSSFTSISLVRRTSDLSTGSSALLNASIETAPAVNQMTTPRLTTACKLGPNVHKVTRLGAYDGLAPLLRVWCTEHMCIVSLVPSGQGEYVSRVDLDGGPSQVRYGQVQIRRFRMVHALSALFAFTLIMPLPSQAKKETRSRA